MKINDVVYAPQKNAAEYSRRPRTDVAPQDAPSAPHTPGEEVVQLSLGHDGIWEVRAASPSPESTLEDSAHAFASVFPHVSRLYHSLWRVYSPAGITPAIEYARGLLVDVYA